ISVGQRTEGSAFELAEGVRHAQFGRSVAIFLVAPLSSLLLHLVVAHAGQRRMLALSSRLTPATLPPRVSIRGQTEPKLESLPFAQPKIGGALFCGIPVWAHSLNTFR